MSRLFPARLRLCLFRDLIGSAVFISQTSFHLFPFACIYVLYVVRPSVHLLLLPLLPASDSVFRLSYFAPLWFPWCLVPDAFTSLFVLAFVFVCLAAIQFFLSVSVPLSFAGLSPFHCLSHYAPLPLSFSEHVPICPASFFNGFPECHCLSQSHPAFDLSRCHPLSLPDQLCLSPFIFL